MTAVQSFIGTYIEFSALILLLGAFNAGYLVKSWKFFFVPIASAIVVVFTEVIELPMFAQYMINYVPLILLLSLCFHRKLRYVVFEFFIGVAMIMAIEFLLIIVHDFFMPGMLTFGERLIHLFVLLILCLSLRKKERAILKFRTFYETYKQSYYLVAVNLFGAFLLGLFVWDTDSDNFYKNGGLIIVLMVLWLVVNAYLLKTLISESRAKVVVNTYEKYEEMTEALISKFHQERHEYVKHQQAVLSMCEAGTDYSEIIQYIMEVNEKEIGNRKSQTSFHTGNGLIDGLCYTKIREAEAKGIQLTAMNLGENPQFPCQNYELVEILGNLFDNGMEYLVGIEEHREKSIVAEIGIVGTETFIKVRNSYYGDEGITEKQIKKGRTTKVGQGRGYGLYNVKQIVSRYDGRLKLSSKNQYFEVEIYFNNSQRQSGSPWEKPEVE